MSAFKAAALGQYRVSFLELKKKKMFLGFLKALWGFLPACLCSVEEMCEQWDVAAVGE